MADKPKPKIDIAEFDSIKDQLFKLDDGYTYILKIKKEYAQEFAAQWNSLENRPRIRILLVDENAQFWRSKGHE